MVLISVLFVMILDTGVEESLKETIIARKIVDDVW